MSINKVKPPRIFYSRTFQGGVRQHTLKTKNIRSKQSVTQHCCNNLCLLFSCDLWQCFTGGPTAFIGTPRPGRTACPKRTSCDRHNWTVCSSSITQCYFNLPHNESIPYLFCPISKRICGIYAYSKLHAGCPTLVTFLQLTAQQSWMSCCDAAKQEY